MSDPHPGTASLLGNVYQFQATPPERPGAMLELIRQAVTRRCDGVVVIGGDWSASCRPRLGFAGTVITRSADARLEEWSRQAGLARAAPPHATWRSTDESRMVSEKSSVPNLTTP